MTKQYKDKLVNEKYINVKPTTLTFTQEDHDNTEKVKKFFWIKTRVWAIRKALEEIVRKNEL